MTYVIRTLGILGLFVITYIISVVSSLTLFETAALLSLVLIGDSLIVRYINNLYMRAVYKQMEEEFFKGKDQK